MVGSDSFGLKNLLILSSAHFKSFKLNASFKEIIDLVFNSLANKYSNLSMTRMQGSRNFLSIAVKK